MTAAPLVDRRVALRIALALLGLAAATALAVQLLDAAAVRHWLAFSFPGVPRRIGEAMAIFANNARMLAGILAACLVVQAPYLAGVRVEAGGRFHRAAVATCDAAVGAVALAQTLLVGSAVGAYGTRMVIALLPHGPIELASFAVGLSLYARARREPLSRRRWLDGAGLSATGLLVAALLESLLAR